MHPGAGPPRQERELASLSPFSLLRTVHRQLRTEELLRFAHAAQRVDADAARVSAPSIDERFREEKPLAELFGERFDPASFVDGAPDDGEVEALVRADI